MVSNFLSKKTLHLIIFPRIQRWINQRKKIKEAVLQAHTELQGAHTELPEMKVVLDKVCSALDAYAKLEAQFVLKAEAILKEN